jgi:hypothetical protein
MIEISSVGMSRSTRSKSVSEDANEVGMSKSTRSHRNCNSAADKVKLASI